MKWQVLLERGNKHIELLSQIIELIESSAFYDELFGVGEVLIKGGLDGDEVRMSKRLV